MRLYWLRFRATCHPTEDPEIVGEALRLPTGLDVDAFQERLQVTTIETHHGAEQFLMEVELKRAAEVRTALALLLAGDAQARIASTLDGRIDDDGILYMRLDKQRAAEGDLVLRQADDPISVRGKVEVHPFTRQGAIAAWQEFLQPSS